MNEDNEGVGLVIILVAVGIAVGVVWLLHHA